jgi:hypothetical protein
LAICKENFQFGIQLNMEKEIKRNRKKFFLFLRQKILGKHILTSDFPIFSKMYVCYSTMSPEFFHYQSTVFFSYIVIAMRRVCISAGMAFHFSIYEMLSLDWDHEVA